MKSREMRGRGDAGKGAPEPEGCRRSGEDSGRGVPEERGVPRERGEHRPARSGAVRGRPEPQRGGTRPEGRRTRDSPSPA